MILVYNDFVEKMAVECYVKSKIIQFRKKKLFKNGLMLNLETGESPLVDILLDGQNIVDIKPSGTFDEFDTEVVDLKRNFVLPHFVNAFCDSSKAFENSYKREFVEVENRLLGTGLFKAKTYDFQSLIVLNLFAKNVLAGSGIVNDVAGYEFYKENFIKARCLENIDEKNDKELDSFLEGIHKDKLRPFLNVGRTLDELGSVDKIYNKPLSQVLEDFGFLDLKPIIVGGNCFEKDELELLKQYDCNFVLTPFEDGKVGRRANNLVSLRGKEFLIGIGSGYATEIDFFAYMRQILMNNRSMFENPNVVTEKEVLDMAFNQSSLVLNVDNRIKIGNPASFIVVRNCSSLYDDIFKTLVWEKSKHDVVMTVFCGEIMQKNGEILIQNFPDCDTIKETIKLFSRRKKDDN